jgi:hypothetical protein
MTHKNILTIFLTLWTLCSFGQTDIEKILTEFGATSNDSIFVSKNSKKPYEKFIARRYTIPQVFDETDSVMFYHTNKGDILGPYETDSFLIYIKVTSVDSLFRMRVGNIYLNPEKRGIDKIDRLSNELLTQIKRNKDFDIICKTYADDNNKNQDCDLGWFFQGVMVSEFEKEILKHKKNECFIVNTRFGKHIVKILDDPILDRSTVEYTFLYLDKR